MTGTEVAAALAMISSTATGCPGAGSLVLLSDGRRLEVAIDSGVVNSRSSVMTTIASYATNACEHGTAQVNKTKYHVTLWPAGAHVYTLTQRSCSSVLPVIPGADKTAILAPVSTFYTQLGRICAATMAFGGFPASPDHLTWDVDTSKLYLFLYDSPLQVIDPVNVVSNLSWITSSWLAAPGAARTSAIASIKTGFDAAKTAIDSAGAAIISSGTFNTLRTDFFAALV